MDNETLLVSDNPYASPLGDDPAWRLRMITLYFESVHDTHHSLFHQSTFNMEVRDGKVADVVLYAILALGAR
jgi:hypothetical protein